MHLFRGVRSPFPNPNDCTEYDTRLSNNETPDLKLWVLVHRSDKIIYGGAHGVMVIVVGNGQCDPSSNPGPDWLHFT